MLGPVLREFGGGLRGEQEGRRGDVREIAGDGGNGLCEGLDSCLGREDVFEHVRRGIRVVWSGFRILRTWLQVHPKIQC